MKCLFIFLGESFRGGEWLSRKRGDPHTYAEQKLACYSHIKFLNFINLKFKITTDLIVDTYETPYSDELVGWYGPRVKSYVHTGEAIGYENLYKHSLTLIDDIDAYEFIHFIRIDLYLKDYFFKTFKISQTHLQYAFRGTPIPFIENIPRLNDMMLYVPKIHFNFLKLKIVLFHDLWAWGILQRLRLTKHVSTYIDTIHDSNTKRDWNPIFRIVNRPESGTWEWEGYVCLNLNKAPVYQDDYRNIY